jgi:cytochrome c oxidase assembly protein subunit 15
VFVAGVALGLIVVTGAAVRLTGSGLGCSTWPQCEPGRLVPPLGLHQWVEFGNRLVTLAVGVVVAAVAVASLRVRSRTRRTTLLAWGLVAGYVAQAVIGGLSVVYDLLPGWVMLHFVVSMLLLWDVVVLHHAARWDATRAAAAPARREVVLLARLLAGWAGLVLLVGTVTTGTGPHAGDASAKRLPLRLDQVAQLHADLAFFLAGLIVATLVAIRLTDVPAAVRRRSWWLLAAVGVQIAIGYVQWFSGLPPLVVGMHVAGATVLWTITLLVNLGFSVPDAEPAAVPAQSPATADRATWSPAAPDALAP